MIVLRWLDTSYLVSRLYSIFQPLVVNLEDVLRSSSYSIVSEELLFLNFLVVLLDVLKLLSLFLLQKSPFPMGDLVIQILNAIPVCWRTFWNLVNILLLSVLMDLPIGLSLFFDLVISRFIYGLISLRLN